MALSLIINGEVRSVLGAAHPTELDQVLTALAVRKEIVAIALNGTIVPRTQWKATLVSAGDNVEIVHLVGGGCHPSLA